MRNKSLDELSCDEKKEKKDDDKVYKYKERETGKDNFR